MISGDLPAAARAGTAAGGPNPSPRQFLAAVAAVAGIVLLATVLLPRGPAGRGPDPLALLDGAPVLFAVVDLRGLRGEGASAWPALLDSPGVGGWTDPWRADWDRSFPRWSKLSKEALGLDLPGAARLLSHRLSAAYFGEFEAVRVDGRRDAMPDFVLAVEFDPDLGEVARLVHALRYEPLIWGTGYSLSGTLAGCGVFRYVSDDPGGLEAWYAVAGETLILATSPRRLEEFLLGVRGARPPREPALGPRTVLAAGVASGGDGWQPAGSGRWLSGLARWLAALDVRTARWTARVEGGAVLDRIELAGPARDPPDAAIESIRGAAGSHFWLGVPPLALGEAWLGEAAPGLPVVQRFRRTAVRDALAALGSGLAGVSEIDSGTGAPAIRLYFPGGDFPALRRVAARTAFLGGFRIEDRDRGFVVRGPAELGEEGIRADPLPGGGVSLSWPPGPPPEGDWPTRAAPAPPTAGLAGVHIRQADAAAWLRERTGAARGAFPVPPGPWPFAGRESWLGPVAGRTLPSAEGPVIEIRSPLGLLAAGLLLLPPA